MFGWGYAETHPNPNPKSCFKCNKMPKSNFLFLGVTFIVGYAEMTHPKLKVFPNVAECLNPTFYFLV